MAKATSLIVSSALEAGHILKSGPGIIRTLTVLNFGTDPALIHLLDTATVPANGTIAPKWSHPIAPAGSDGPGSETFSWLADPFQFTTGIVAILSTNITTPFTLAKTSNKDFYSAQVADRK